MEENRLRRTGYFNWIAWFLVLWLNLIVAWCIMAAEWTRGLSVLSLIAAGGVILGTMLSVSRWPGKLAHLHSFITGTFFTCLTVSTLLPERLSWHDRLINLSYRIGYWLQEVMKGRPGSDALIFILALGLILWWIAVFSVWQLFRRGDAWLAIIPGGINIIINLYYGPPKLRPYLLLYLLTAFALILWLNFKEQERAWASNKVGYTPYIGFDFFRYGATFIVLLLILTWLAPSMETPTHEAGLLHSLQKPWERVQNEWNRLFSSLRGYRSRGNSPIAFGKELPLGGPVGLGERLIMEVETDPPFLGRYWKAASYDFYTGRGWLNTDEIEIPLGAGDYPPMPSFKMRAPLTQTYYIVEPQGSLLFAVYQPVRVIIPAFAYVMEIPQDDGSIIIEPSLLYSRRPLPEGKAYKVVSLISRAGEKSLRKAGTDYPEWVTSRYLQLPPELPERVKSLARELTAPYDNPYDKATAIERYLRNNIAYNEDIPPPPEGRDAVDYFLFDLREGYCNYYASAMVVMARAVGIPARLASGYARGEYDFSLKRWKVRDKHAHGWVEVFFPGYGWVEFEPTSAQPPIIRPAEGEGSLETRRPDRHNRIPEDVELPTEANPPALPEVQPENWQAFLSRLRPPGWLRNLLWFLAAVSLLGWLAWRYLEPAHLSLAARFYLRLQRLGQLAGCKPQPYHTPYEYAGILSRLTPERAEAILTLVGLYVKERFGGYELSREEGEKLHQAWRTVLPGLLKAALLRRGRKKPKAYPALSTRRDASSQAFMRR